MQRPCLWFPMGLGALPVLFGARHHADPLVSYARMADRHDACEPVQTHVVLDVSR